MALIAPNDDMRADISNVQQSLVALQEKGLVWKAARGVYALEDTSLADLLQVAENAKPPPSNELARIALIADLQSHGAEIKDIDVAPVLIGPITQITDLFVVQSLGRNAVVVHALDRLSGSFAIGQMAEIKYTEGQGHDLLQGLSRSNEHPGRG